MLEGVECYEERKNRAKQEVGSVGGDDVYANSKQAGVGGVAQWYSAHLVWSPGYKSQH